MSEPLRGDALALPAHRLVPMLIVLLALLAIGVRYQWQMHHIEAEVVGQEIDRLRDRLSVEQSRLDETLASKEPMLLRRIVGVLGLHNGLCDAVLIDPQHHVVASLRRSDLGRAADEVLTRDVGRKGLLNLLRRDDMGPIEVSRLVGSPGIGASVPLLDGHRLGVQVDVEVPIARRRAAVQREMVIEAALALGVAVLLSLLLHLLWFRRARRLADALKHMGAGHLTVRTGVRGNDELALIGRTADQMAEQLQADRAQALHMSTLVNRSPLVVIEWRHEPGWPVRYVNENIRHWGYEPERLVDGRVRFADLLHPEDAGWVGEEVDRYLEEGPDEYRQEYRVMRADGSWVWVHDHTWQERDAQGRVVSISGILLDITARKQAQQAQQEQAELLRLFYELPFIGMAITSPETRRWLQVNDRLCEILGYPRDELLSKTWPELTPDGDLERNLALFDSLLAGERDGYRMEKRFRRKDGQFVHTEIDVKAVRHVDGTLQRLFTTVQDVSERKRYEQELRQMQDQLLKAQRIGHMGSWTLDLRSRRFIASPQALSIYGTDPKRPEMTLEEADALVVPEDRALVRDVVRRGVEAGEPCDLRCRIVNPVRGVRHVHVRAEFEREDGQFVRCIGMVLDETELVEAQRERDRLVSVLEATPDIVSMVDPQGRVFYFNRAGHDVMGVSREQPLADAMPVHPPWAARLIKEVGLPSAAANGTWLGETAVYDAQGRELPMSQLVVAHRDADGQLQYFSTILRDITERKASEAALALERSRLDEAQAVAHIGSWSVQLPGDVVSWSAHHFHVLGLEPTAVVPSMEAYLRVVHPDDQARVRAHLDTVPQLRPGEVIQIEHRIVTAQGVRHVEERAGVEWDVQDRLVRIFGTTMDVTERVLADQAARDLRDMLEQAETVSLLGSWAADAQTQHLNVSPQLFRNLGLAPGERPPSTDEYLARIHPDDQARVAADMQTIREGGPPADIVFRTHPQHGPLRWLRRTARRIERDDEGLKPRYIGTLLDITESVLAEEKLRRANLELEHRVAERTAQLSQANQELEAFSYTVSHDLKAPLRGIDGYSQLLLEEYGPRLDDEGRRFVQRIRHGVQLMSELISDLLEYSRMERRDMAQEPVALRPLIEQIVDGYHADIQRMGAEVVVVLDPVTLPLDREGISVVLRNLVGNALKFSRERKPPRVVIGGGCENGRQLLWVRDNGVGFDMKYHDRMFGIFQRLHRAEEFPGTGVGLALVAKAVQRMGGRVWAEGVLGTGATFYLEFPA